MNAVRQRDAGGRRLMLGVDPANACTYFAMMASADRRPSTAALTMPPA